MEKQADSKVIARLRKLLALANDARGNENEAEVAMGRAQEIMAEYNLSLAQIGGAETEETKRAKGSTANALYQWQRKLMRAIAEVNFCFHEVTQVPYTGPANRKYTHIHSLIGREANVTASRTMFEYLLETMDRLAPKGEGRTRTEASWKEGCADRLIVRLRDRRAELEAASRKKAEEERARAAAGGSNGTALVVVLEDVYQTERDLNDDFRYGREPGTTARLRRENQARWAKMEAEAAAKLEAERAAETPEMRAAREKQEAKDKAKREKEWERYWKRSRRGSAGKQRDWDAYSAGSEAGKDIGLDAQIDKKDGLRAIQ